MMRQRRLAAVESEALFTNESERAEAGGRCAPPRAAADAAAPAAGLGRRGHQPAAKPLLVPTPGPIVRRFGEALASGGPLQRPDLRRRRRGPVASPGPGGTSQYVGPVKGWGVILILRLAGGYHLVLAGLDRTSVSVGQSVAAGQAVGLMPDGRQSTGDGETRPPGNSIWRSGNRVRRSIRGAG